MPFKDHLTTPHGGTLVEAVVDPVRAAELRDAAGAWPSWDLTPRQLCDLELILNGGFSPLSGFLGKLDYEGVLGNMRLANGTLWPIPVTLDVPEPLAERLSPGARLVLRNAEGAILAVLTVDHVWRPDRAAEAQAVFGTDNTEHPGVQFLVGQTHPVYVGGRVEGLQLPVHYDFPTLRQTAAELRAAFGKCEWRSVVVFQTRNPMHRAHVELTVRAAREAQAGLLIHPVVGMTKPGDIDHYTRVRCYQAILPRYPDGMAMLSLLPLAMRMAGPREAVWHAIIRKNYGCTHLIVGRDHAGPGSDSRGRPFYEPYEAQDLLRQHEAELNLRMVPFRNVVYLADDGRYVPEDEVPQGARALSISGTELRSRLAAGDDVPEWFTYPEVVSELRRTHPPQHERGFTVFFTGLPASGKSTIARVLLARLLELEGRPVTLLDGDLVRKHLSSELGFGREHRDINIRRIGFVAAEVTRHGGVAICAPIAPYDAARKEARRMVEGMGGFLLVHVATPLAVCERRDPKGLYARARAGTLKGFTGISDPYEPPADAELTIDASVTTPEEAARQIVRHLSSQGYLKSGPRLQS